MSFKTQSAKIGFAVLVSCFALYCLTNNIVDPDLWGHIRFGLDILENGGIPRLDGYSYTAFGAPWINHEWASELIFSLLYVGAGGAGIIGIRLTFGMAIFGIALRRLWKDIECGYEWFFLCACLVVSISSYGLCFRPQIFSYLFFTILILLLLRRPRFWPFFAFFIFMLWANCHGGFIMGLMALALFSGTEVTSAFQKREPVRALCFICVACACLCATLLNPYGTRLWSFLYSTIRLERPYLLEWQPIPLADISFIDFKALLTIFIVAVTVARRTGKTWLFLLTLICAAAAFVQNRHVPFFAIAAAFSLSTPLNTVMIRLRNPLRKSLENAAFALHKASFVFSALLVAAIFFLRGGSSWSLEVESDKYPVMAVRWLKERGIKGNCAVFFNWGEYVIWHLRGEIKVSIDGRYDTVYSEKVIDENFRFFFAEKGWDALLANYPTGIVLIHPLNPISAVMEKMPGWTLAFRSDTALIFLSDHAYPAFAGKEPSSADVQRRVPFP